LLALVEPDLAWLRHPALTGLTEPDWDSLLTTLLTLHDQQREVSLHRRRGDRPRHTAPGTGRRPLLTLADRLIAATLHYRHGLPQVTIAALFTVRPETINKQLRRIRELLQQAGHTIPPSPDKIATIEDLYRYAAANGITTPPNIKTAS
jgi:hypothetical protein